MFTVYGAVKSNSSRVGKLFAKGARLPYVELPHDTRLRPGGMVSFGDAYGLRSLLSQVQDEGRQWVYIDNGYFKPGHFSGYYRVTRNDYQHNGTGRHSARRWKALGLQIKPWRKAGSFILLCPPGDSFGRHRGWDVSNWLAETMAELRQHTDRPLVVRKKPPYGERRTNSIQMALRGAHALVTYMSNTAVDALLEGVPVFCTGQCAAYRMGTHDLSKIETPLFPNDREQFMWNLAANQWTIREMLAGRCWRELMQ